MDALDKDLLHRLTNGTITSKEREEFLRRYRQGELDHLITPDMRAKILEEGATASIEETISLDQNYEHTITRNNIGRQAVPISGRRKSRVWLSAAAVIVLVIVAGSVLLNKEEYFSSLVSQRQEEVKPSVYTGKQLVNLPDGSTALLNDNSELKFTKAFGTSNREVLLTGEALFDVKHDPSKPFVVHTGKVTTKVLGTEFNINAYPGQDKITVTVLHGLVEVGDEKRIYGQIRPNERIAVNTQSLTFVQEKTNVEEAVQWKAKFLILDNVTMEEAARIIGERFKRTVTISNPALRSCIISVTFLNGEEIDHVLETLTIMTKSSYVINKNFISISGGKCS